ncbi:DUF5684 domain-containing protein [Flavobacterium sp. RHBU_24]|uniref:DUF5684 domain-containing protein n=1 Tax=Flavobacterium sp. RHBU_24 TaxID=3391185 RepID=UPI0039856883
MEGLITILFILFFGILILMIISQWKIYEKAGKPGWAVLVPIYSTIVLIEIIKKPGIWLLWFLIPGVNIIFAIWAINLLSKSFGKSEGFTIGLLFLPYIFYPILAFDKSIQYIYGNNGDDINEIGSPEVV